MEGTFNLKTASEYINNLLLARGLLRDGKKIQFAHPSRGEGGKEATMAQVINLVHDLILKRDVRLFMRFYGPRTLTVASAARPGTARDGRCHDEKPAQRSHAPNGRH